MDNFRLIAVSNELDLPNETAAWESLLTAGLTHLHLRKPHWDKARTAACLKSLSPELRACVRLHDYHGLASRYHVGGIHLNARHPLPPKGYKGAITRSCHTLEEVARYKPDCEYVLLSPIYKSISKRGYKAAFTTNELREAAANGIIDHKVMAMGGVTADKLPQLKALGFGGAAVLGALWHSYICRPYTVVSWLTWNAFRIVQTQMAIDEMQMAIDEIKREYERNNR